MIPRTWGRFVAAVCVYSMIISLAAPVVTQAASTRVAPIAWNAFPAGRPKDADSERMRMILLHANRYALTTWWTERGYAGQTDPILTFYGRGEDNIRPAANEAFALAVILATGAYDERVTGIPRDRAEAITKKLIRSLARRHRANTPNGWGNGWQTANWATSAGFAGWLLWDRLSPDERRDVQNMVIYESNRFNAYRVPYYQGKDGRIQYPGDTKAEENAWNGMILQLSTAMMPEHPNRNLWRSKMLGFIISAFARPSDAHRQTLMHGRPLAEWLNGSNANEDGSVTNQRRLHPDYMTTVSMNLHTALTYGLARLPVPAAALFNAKHIYRAMSEGVFNGATIYQPGSADVRYPQGTRWGTHRRMHFALLDAQATAFGLDRDLGRRGTYWERFHAHDVLTLQRRSSDRRTYQAPGEDTYGGREAWVADLAAQAYLTKFIKANGLFRLTTDALPYVQLDS